MVEVLYRIYEVADEQTAEQNMQNCGGLGLSTSQARNIELLMDCMVCDDREHFKSVIRDMYGQDIPFRYSKKLEPGKVYCIIIAEHCYNVERYFNKVCYDCDFCGSRIEAYFGRPVMISDYEINSKLFNIQDYKNKRFCGHTCKERFIEREKLTLKPDDDDHFWVTRDSFTRDHAGYIYKITKKSSGQFYVGQTMYVPIFRWGEHLLTARFPITEISDYQFEVLEVVPKDTSLLEREKYWIQKLYSECPEKSLNIAGTKNIERRQKKLC